MILSTFIAGLYSISSFNNALFFIRCKLGIVLDIASPFTSSTTVTGFNNQSLSLSIAKLVTGTVAGHPLLALPKVEAFNICLRKIKNHDLPMRLIDVEFTFDVNKIIFYFTADGRIDFRELVKDLASVFRTRIELRQIGVRDEAKMLGGIGSCGRPLCCATFLGDFEPVSIRMAKDQNLSLNPTKISGICGRLMCCLKYENHMYCKGCGNGNKRERVEIPKMGALVATPLGEGKVVGVNRGQHTASVKLAPDNIIQVEWDEIVDASQADNV